ncbi:protein Malvolio-like [Macrosteles quadrilineatus]|uniref:protein Malvolio-like n=1 Tax=Macrosteles quadrilineatus TaxID=74068 RepID=UPI0023E20163|nr:protein Malvolio-like [Macrosteles quadrilineatus]XP_054266643.1 protein Malvolio-like [Macrosteles quadrilineatus]XP_054266644.1 protein Malvolio-like [Macrosteles quadrilineatus]
MSSEQDEYDCDNDTPKIQIPETENDDFSFRKLWAFTGPGFLLCVAYLDPGNIEADLQAGVVTKYKILWVLLGSTVLGLMMQRLSLRLGVVTGRHLAEMCHLQYPTLPRLFLWLMIEVAIIGSDMQEVIGTAIALYLLSNKLIPLWVGVVITVVDTFMFLLLDRYGLRRLELFFAMLVAVMVFTFGYEFVVARPSGAEMLKGLVVPWCENCDSSVLLQAIGIIGSTIMPHNLYLHSGLVKSRQVDRSKANKVREANKYFFFESFMGLTVSFTINALIVSVFASELYEHTNADVMKICLDSDVPHDNIFPNNTEIVELDIYKSGIFLGCRFGLVAMYIWGIGVLAAGEGTTMTGCYAGQLAMEGFLHLKWSRWKRVFFTRSIAIVPTFFIAFFNSISDLSGLNDMLNAVMSIQIPFATLPLVAFTSNPHLMGEFVNCRMNVIFMLLVSVMVIAINVMFVISSVLQAALQDYWLLYALAAYSLMYFAMCGYLVLHMYANLSESKPAFAKMFVKGSDWRNKNIDSWIELQKKR